VSVLRLLPKAAAGLVPSAQCCALWLCSPFTRPPWQHAPEHPPGPSLLLLAGPVAPAAGQSPPIGRPAQERLWATGTGTDWPPCCSHITGRWAKWRAPLASAHWSGWSGVRQSSTHAPLLAAAPARLHAQALPHTHPLLLSHSVGRSGLSFFLCGRPLSSLSSSSSQPSLHVLDIRTLPTRDRPLCPSSPHESAAFMVCFVFSPLPASFESPCPSRRILSSP
jgi:hypothetical protein